MRDSVCQKTVNGWSVEQRPDLTTIVTKRFSVTGTAWTAWGSMYEAKFNSEQSYPVTFIEKPAVTIWVVHQDAAFFIRLGGTESTTQCHAVYGLRPTTAVPTAMTYELVAIGKASSLV